VDSLDRDVICKTGFDKVTAVLTVTNLPFDSEMTVVEPAQFAGPFKTGKRLPKGLVRLEVRAPGQINEVFTIVLNGPTNWQGKTGLKKRKGPLVPDGFLTQESPKKTGETAGSKTNGREEANGATEAETGPKRWPSYTSAAIGAGLVGLGIGLGLDNRDSLAKLRADESRGMCSSGSCNANFERARSRAQLADGLWISGAVAMLSSVALWYLFDTPEGE
jgi:hypothetical protein